MKQYPIMRTMGYILWLAAVGLIALVAGTAIVTTSPGLAPMVMSAAVIAVFLKPAPDQNTNTNKNVIQVTQQNNDNKIVQLLESQNELLAVLPDQIASAVALEVAKIKVDVPTIAPTVVSVPVPGTWDTGEKPSKIVLDARKWLDDHPEHAGKTVRAIAELSGFSKSTIDRAKKLAA